MDKLVEPLDTRLEIRISASELERLRNIQHRTEARSYAQVVRDALKVYETTLNKRKTP